MSLLLCSLLILHSHYFCTVLPPGICRHATEQGQRLARWHPSQVTSLCIPGAQTPSLQKTFAGRGEHIHMLHSFPWTISNIQEAITWIKAEVEENIIIIKRAIWEISKFLRKKKIYVYIKEKGKVPCSILLKVTLRIKTPFIKNT